MGGRIFVLILAVGVGIGIGGLTVARLASDDPSVEGVSQQATEGLAERLTRGESSELDPEQVADVVESLIRILDEEISERRVLAEQLEEMRSEITELRQLLGIPQVFSTDTSSTVSRQQDAQVDQTTEGRLAASGFTPQQIETLQRREAEALMQRIDVDDRARREGWVDTPRYFDELNSIGSGADTVRSDLGDDAYSRYLFARGRPNRITIGTVIETSPAQLAGFQPGDVIRSYGGERVFSAQQLTKLRSTGAKGMPVAVEIIRDGELMQISIPRGPMGVQTRPDVIDPNAPGGG